MDLTDRYLTAIGVLLPRETRDDIITELRDALETHAEEKRSDLGRALTAGEESELLRSFGHPLAVAARYGPRQYLVGPELYPLYMFALKIVLAFAAVSALVAGTVAAILHPDDWGVAVRAALSAIWHGAIGTLAALTFAAAVIERYDIRLGFLTQWNPNDLPEVRRWPLFRPQTTFEHIAGLVVQTLFILWWIHVLPVGLPYLTSLQLRPGQHLELVPALVWRSLFWPVLGLALAAVTVHILMLARQSRRAYVRALALLQHVATLTIGVMALRAGHWVDVSGSGLPAGALAKIDFGVNIGLEFGLVALSAFAALLAARDAWSLRDVRAGPA